MRHNLEFLLASFNGFKEVGKTKSFMKIMQKELDLVWFHGEGIEKQFSGHYTVSLKDRLFNFDSTLNISTYATEQQVNKACESIGKFIVHMKTYDEPSMLKIYAHIERSCASDNSNRLTLESFLIVKQTKAVAVIVQEVNNVVTEPDEDIKKAVADYLTRHGINLKVESGLKKIEENWDKTQVEFKDGVSKSIKQEVADAVNDLRPVVVKIGDKTEIKFEGKVHAAFERCLKLIRRGKQQVFVAGPAGTGKTTLASQIAKALSLDFGFVSCNLGMSKAELLGRMDANGRYIMSDFVKLYENGGLFLFDEVDAADANTMLIINSALANGKLAVPSRSESQYADRHPNFYCMCAANTWGFGSADYVGRNILDAAFLDRFATSRLIVDYDRQLEQSIAGKDTKITKIIWQIRDNCKEARMKRVISTRAIEGGVEAISDGDSINQFLDTLMTGWSSEERTKALKNVVVS